MNPTLLQPTLAATPPTPPTPPTAATPPASPPPGGGEGAAAGNGLLGQFGVNEEQLAPFLAEFGLRILGVIIIALAAWVLARWVRRALYKALTRAKFDETLTRFISTFSKYIILILALVTVLGMFGVQTTSLAAVVGAAGLTIGLAMQGSLQNIAAGIMLLIFRPFKVGDLILCQGQMGKVDEIELFFTRVDTMDNRRLIVPNSQLFNATLENITHHPHRRADIPVGVSYSADIDATRTALERALTLIPGALKDPEPAVFLKGFGASSVDWELRVWAPAKDFGAVRQQTVRAIKLALDEAGLSIPFPQMDVHFFPKDPLRVQAEGAGIPTYSMAPKA